jgi:hypothetical protein
MFSTLPRQGDGKIPCPSMLTFRLFGNTVKLTMAHHAAHDPRVCDNKDPKPNESFCAWYHQPT